MSEVIDISDSETSLPAAEVKGTGGEAHVDTAPAKAKRQRTSLSWALPRLHTHPVTLRRGVSSSEQAVADGDLPKLAPATLIRNALPASTADALLEELMLESNDWVSTPWRLHGRTHETPRVSASYQLSEESSSLSPAFKLAAERMGDLVATLRPGFRWSPSFVLANKYANGQDCVGWHSDFLGDLGPRPVIVGLSLGARRRFCLRQSQPNAPPSTISIPMPHNSVVVMWDDCQESWQHSVPRVSDASIGRHARAGTTRISLTFRMARPELDIYRKTCYCGRPCALKSKEGKYYVACSPVNAGEQCGFFEVCQWAQKEADKLRDNAVPLAAATNATVVLE